MMTENNATFQLTPEAQQQQLSQPPPPPQQQQPSTLAITATMPPSPSVISPVINNQQQQPPPTQQQQSAIVAQPVLMHHQQQPQQQTIQSPFSMQQQLSSIPNNPIIQTIIKEEDIKHEPGDLKVEIDSKDFAMAQSTGSSAQLSQPLHQYHSDVKPTILVRPPSQQENRSVVGRLCYQDDVLYITEGNSLDIGRNSSTSSVHFHVGQNNFISRKHFQIVHDANNGDFYIIVVSKNGIFIDDQFTRKSHDPERLPRVCKFRFPSTDIRINFESFIEKDYDDYKKIKPKLIDQTLMANGVYSPLKIKIPKIEKKSPPPSPTGTLSAANSCPTSPRQSFRDYHHHNSSSHNNNNNNNNNNGYQNDAHGPASSATSSSQQNEYEKPLYSYAQLIVQSISASPEKQLTLSGIYSFITKNYPYYRKEANKGWQNSIRHNLSLNRYFWKVERSQDEPGKGSFWRIDPNSEAKLIDQSYRKRRQRGSQCFRTPYGMPRSAPASPSHIDHHSSRDSSPLHDIILQSAPGSPQQQQQQQQQLHQQAIGGHNHQQQQQQQSSSSNAQRNGTSVPLPMWPE